MSRVVNSYIFSSAGGGDLDPDFEAWRTKVNAQTVWDEAYSQITSDLFVALKDTVWWNAIKNLLILGGADTREVALIPVKGTNTPFFFEDPGFTIGYSKTTGIIPPADVGPSSAHFDTGSASDTIGTSLTDCFIGVVPSVAPTLFGDLYKLYGTNSNGPIEWRVDGPASGRTRMQNGANTQTPQPVVANTLCGMDRFDATDLWYGTIANATVTYLNRALLDVPNEIGLPGIRGERACGAHYLVYMDGDSGFLDGGQLADVDAIFTTFATAWAAV